MSNQFDVTKLKSILDLAKQTVACDADCMRDKVAQGLKEHYEKAKKNALLAEPDMEQARQQYVTFVSGKGTYQKLREKELINEAKNTVKQLSTKHAKEKSEIDTQIKTYNNLITHHKNSKDLLDKYVQENASMTRQLKTQSDHILINERKTFYEDQQNDQLNTYYYSILLILYIIIVCVFGVFSLKYPSTYSWKSRAFMLLFFATLPIISPWILGKIIQILYLVYSLLPKNVYHSS